MSTARTPAGHPHRENANAVILTAGKCRRWRLISAVRWSCFAKKNSSVSRTILGTLEIFVRLIAAQKIHRVAAFDLLLVWTAKNAHLLEKRLQCSTNALGLLQKVHESQ